MSEPSDHPQPIPYRVPRIGEASESKLSAGPRRLIYLVATLVALILYLSGPIIAGMFEIGDRAGPKIYPIGLHELLYTIAFEANSNHVGKPRLSATFREDQRPWFYGM